MTVASSPSGTLATMIPIPKIRQVMKGYFKTMPIMKKKIPMIIEMTEIIAMNLSSSFLKGVVDVLAVAARFAIYPITVSSPILITIPIPFPSLQMVPKNARLSVSSAFLGAVHMGVLSRSFDSPVKDELSTLNSLDLIIRISEGILSPALT